MTSLLGKQLGRYHIQEEIGRGGMARVYRAYDPQLQRQIALKVLAPQLALDTEYIQRFQREAIIAANLHHPNIVTIYDVSEIDGLHFIAMEYIRGRSLHAIINERGALGLANAVAIINAVGSALDYAHRQGAIHRDVKPHNIMINISGRVLLADFGIAQMPEARGDRLTRTGIFIGTPEYISPEQASARHVDGRSDLYSLGITAYELITGTVPFSGATPQLMIAHLQSAPPPLSTLDPNQPPELDTVLARALAKNPDTRYQTGAAFAEALRQVAHRYGLVEADAAQLATLALPLPSPEGQVTAHVPTDETARQPVSPPPIKPIAPPPLAPKPVVRNDDDDDQTTVLPSRPGNPNPTAPSIDRRWIWFALGLLLLLGLGSLVVQGSNRPTAEPPTATTAPIPTLPSKTPQIRATTVPLPSPSAVPLPATTLVPSSTPEPTEQSTEPPAPTRRPTRTPTQQPAPTDTEQPTETIEPTAVPTTAVPPTVVPTTAVPTTVVPTTAVPPSLTPTEPYPPPSPPTVIPSTAIPPTPTELPSPTATASFTVTSTATATSTATHTSTPSSTLTPTLTLATATFTASATTPSDTPTNIATLEPTNTVQITDTPTP